MKPKHVRKRGTTNDFEHHRFLGISHFRKNICLNISDFGRSPRYAAKVEQAFLTDHTEQIERIKVKLRAARKADPHRKVFGASSHRYKLKTPLRHHDLQTFERRYSITLPSCYRAFATEIGNGGPSFRESSAGPFYGIYPLGECVDELLENPTDSLKKPAIVEPAMTDEHWARLTHRIKEEHDITDEDYEQEFARNLPKCFKMTPGAHSGFPSAATDV